jgi:26S proteasome non-ATPase regulatory subunit 9
MSSTSSLAASRSANTPALLLSANDVLCCRFGAAVAGSGSELQQVAQELQAHENQQVPVVFLRAGQAVQMQLVPRKWAGRGLLGCHLRPL